MIRRRWVGGDTFVNWPFPYPIRGRSQFGELLTCMGLINVAVEVGTHIGMFADTLLSTWPGHLWCVDPWEDHPDYREQYKGLSVDGATGDIRQDHKLCIERLARHGSRVTLLQSMSRDAAPDFDDSSLDFVYIDANHMHKYVCEDLSLWYPKLRSGGMLAGHDYNSYKDVTSAVDRFAAENRLDVVEVRDKHICHSYYVVKP